MDDDMDMRRLAHGVLGSRAMAVAQGGALAALAHKDFRYYAAGRFLATLALQMQNLAVGFQVYALTRRKIDLAYVGLAQFLPIISLSIGAGQLADKFDRRIILMACDAVFCVGKRYRATAEP